MREIKFRAWDKQLNRFVYFTLKDVFEGCMGYGDYTDFELMQYTGLKDKHGKEIYEGDFIKCQDDVMLVVWNEKFGSFALDKSGWLYHHFFGEAVHPDSCEVIGNIYENPELLEKKAVICKR